MATLGQYDPSKMTAQEVFDAACDHLLEQNARSMNSSNSTCVYKGPNGLCCGAAPFLVNYDPEMEEITYDDIVNDNHPNHRAWKQPADHMDLIREIQRIHDIHEPDKWRFYLRRLADRLGLTMNLSSP